MATVEPERDGDLAGRIVGPPMHHTLRSLGLGERTDHAGLEQNALRLPATGVGLERDGLERAVYQRDLHVGADSDVRDDPQDLGAVRIELLGAHAADARQLVAEAPALVVAAILVTADVDTAVLSDALASAQADARAAEQALAAIEKMREPALVLLLDRVFPPPLDALS